LSDSEWRLNLLKIDDIFKALNESHTRYLLVGGLASILYGVPRTTVDIDIAISISRSNVERVITVFKKIDLVADTESVEDILAQGGITFSNEREVDVITSLPSNEHFDELWKRRKKVKYHDIVINVISKKDQIRMLEAVGRKQDLEDAGILKD